MKTPLFKTFGLTIFLTAFTALAYQVIDTTTLTTNATHGSAFISIPGVCTNAAYTVTNPISVVIGDPMPAAFGKVNTNFYTLNLLINTVSNTVLASNSAVVGAISLLALNFNSTSNAVVASNLLFSAAMSAQADTNALLAGDIAALQDLPAKVTALEAGGVYFTNRFSSLVATNGDGTALRLISRFGTPYYIVVDEAGVLSATNALP